ncbi:DUF2750 domain-containing protein [Chitinophaga oryziterrae]|uniref:DUF2750 domain-containing protein n=1 Tax=Chitinophaga oryziterrae TaxID=1031224 RepID=A0A6N8JBT0_9BACT|nr:DUF2750 domain-containing protein [Chitinophaga oryziterrae]MVT41908.1 DUF2750 domain-containing protein [Chitinophaga oryziterrae]
MNNHKVQNIIKLSKEERFSYFVNKIVDFEQIWGLNNDGWAVLGSQENAVVMPFWPEENFAERCISEEWRGFRPQAISLQDFLDKWLPGMEKDNRLVAVFYFPELKENIIIPPQELKSAILREQEQYL